MLHVEQWILRSRIEMTGAGLVALPGLAGADGVAPGGSGLFAGRVMSIAGGGESLASR
jgi:hypothetical protein